MTTHSILLPVPILKAESQQSLERLFQAVQWCKFGVLPQLLPILHPQTQSCQKCNWGYGIKVVSPGTANGAHVIHPRTMKAAAQPCPGNVCCGCGPAYSDAVAIRLYCQPLLLHTYGLSSLLHYMHHACGASVSKRLGFIQCRC